jgi:hypothetical protein
VASCGFGLRDDGEVTWAVGEAHCEENVPRSKITGWGSVAHADASFRSVGATIGSRYGAIEGCDATAVTGTGFWSRPGVDGSAIEGCDATAVTGTGFWSRPGVDGGAVEGHDSATIDGCSIVRWGEGIRGSAVEGHGAAVVGHRGVGRSGRVPWGRGVGGIGARVVAA